MQLERDYGVRLGYLRVRALPLTSHVKEFVSRYERIYVVEQNRDGQFGDLIKMEVPEFAGKIRKVLHYDGLPIDARFVTNQIAAAESYKKE